MRVVARLKSVKEMDKLINLGVDIFCVDTALTVRKINGELYKELDLILKHSKVYLLVNKMIHEDEFNLLIKTLELAKNENIEGVVCGDITVMIQAKEMGLENKIIYQPGTMNTNSFDDDYYFIKGIKGLTISKEITLEEIERIFENKLLELSLIGHGFIDMFYSKRKLLTNYFNFKGIEDKFVINSEKFRLKEEMRPDSFYPIFEDEGGTHIFRDKALESYAEFEKLAERLDDFFVERIFMSDEEYYDSLRAYQNKEYRAEFLNKYQGNYNKGFYYQYTEKLKGELSED